MEVLISGKKVYYNSESDEPRSSKMRTWESVTSKDRFDYGRSVMKQLLKKCKNTNVRILLNCFAPFLTGVNFNRVSVVAEVLRSLDRPEVSLVAMCCFLDTRGLESPMPKEMPDRAKMINVLVDIVLARLKNYMPNKCGTCRRWYTVPFGTIPDVICALCSRGRHDCTPVPLRHRSEKCFWFCIDCGIDIKDEFEDTRRKYFTDVDLDNEPKKPKRHTGATESISSHVEVKSCCEDEDDDHDSNNSTCSLLLDSDVESVCDVTLSDYDTDNYEYFQKVDVEEQRPTKSREMQYTMPVESQETKDNVSDKVFENAKKHYQKKTGPDSEKLSDYMQIAEREYRVSQEEIKQAISMIACDVGLNVNSKEKTVPGISLIKGKNVLSGPLSKVFAMCLKDGVVPDDSRKANVYYLVKDIKALLN